MTEFFIAIAVFIASHVIVAFKPLRHALSDRIGEKTFLIFYGLFSTVVLVWLFTAYFDAPYVELWPFAEWARWVPILVMPVACILAVAGLSSPNPLSLGAGSKGYDPERPGIVALTRHPVIWGLILWSGAHIIPNGDMASVILFGLLTGLGLYGPLSLDAKRRERLGAEEWRNMARQAKAARFCPGEVGWLRVAGGMILYLAFLFSHEWIIGVSPFPL
ncbi:MAG: NnrU family protein [Rhodospirillales bacterium]|nr:NnrU family protein [Rhodospirillales bacterium]MCW8861109.1 NnrU family protein [Rhodospirillales bacterium]MCW9002691.1 NnrU family protein [Rhodospirillales bacterium]MCW9040888.1 NnrU family protein [Rhodospirillales bacterium]